MLVHPVSVFILDDSPQLMEMLRELISDPGRIEVVGTASSAIEALESIRLSIPDVAIVDLQLKDGSGFDFVKSIRLLPQTQDVVIMLFTNHVSRELQHHALALGANYFFDKSKDHAKILDVLQSLVRTRERTNDADSSFSR